MTESRSRKLRELLGRVAWRVDRKLRRAQSDAPYQPAPVAAALSSCRPRVYPHVGGYLFGTLLCVLLAGFVAALGAENAANQPERKAFAPSAVRRGYDIPLIDLAGDTARQIIIDKEPGQYLGHPTTVLLEDNKTMIVVYPKGHGRGAIVMKRSVDGGRTWSERLPTPQSWTTSKEVPTIHRVLDQQGVKRLILFSGLYPVRMSVSEDDGKNWSELRSIGEFGGVVTMSSVERLKNGDYMALFHDDGRFIRESSKPETPIAFDVYKTLSTDGGLTWSQPKIIATHPSAHLCEPGLVRSPDQNMIAVLLRENSRKFDSFLTFSSDEGEHWSLPREMPGALTGDRHTARYAPDGRLVVVFRDMALQTSTKGDFVAWVGTFDDILRGRQGQYRVRLLDNQSSPSDTGYAGLELLPDGTFVATTYCVLKQDEKPLVVSVRFSLRESDKLVKDGAQSVKEK